MRKFVTFIIAVMSVLIKLAVRSVKKITDYQNSFPRDLVWCRKKLKDCISADGSPYYVYFKKGKTSKTVVYFSGGGLCWDEYTAARPTTIGSMILNKESYYLQAAPFYLEGSLTGLLAANDPRNPFNEWNYVYLPYSTGDFHIGNDDFQYEKNGRKHSLHFHGYRNVTNALGAAPKEFFEAEEVLIAGESAGGFACVAWASKLADYFHASNRFIVYTDSAQIKSENWHDIITNIWKAPADLYPGERTNNGQIVLDWLLNAQERLNGKGIFLQTISSHDGVLAAYESKFKGGVFEADHSTVTNFYEGLSESVLNLIDRIPEYRCFIFDYGRDGETGATAHTVARDPNYLFECVTNGISVGEWLRETSLGANFKNIGLENLIESRQNKAN